MARVRLNDLNDNLVDITKNNGKITKPINPQPVEKEPDPRFDMNNVVNVSKGDFNSTASSKDLNEAKEINAFDILPPKPVDTSLQNELFDKLDKAVERTKKQISNDMEAIMDKIREEEMEGITNDMDDVNNEIEEETPPRIANDHTFDDSDIEEELGNDVYDEEDEDDVDDYLLKERVFEQVREEEINNDEENIVDNTEVSENEDDSFDDFDPEVTDDDIKSVINGSDNMNNNSDDEEEEDINSPNNKKVIKIISTEVKEKISNKINKIDISKFRISKKPISATKAMKISATTRGNTADWALLAAKRSITVKSLSGSEIVGLRNRNGSKNRLNTFRDIFHILYTNIIDPNKPDFETWLKTTRYSDIDHIYFAYYMATFDGSNFVHYTCTNKKCKKKVFLKDIRFEDMVKYKDKNAERLVNKIRSNDTTTSNSEYDVDLIQVSDNYVVGIRLPSIWNVVIDTASLSDSFIDKYGDLIDTITYIDSMYVINRNDGTLDPIDIKYDKNDQTKSAARKIRVFNDILKTLSSDQFYALREAINELDDELDLITYQIPEAICPCCAQKIKAENMDPDSMLFTRHQLGVFASIPNSSIQ